MKKNGNKKQTKYWENERNEKRKAKQYTYKCKN